MLNPKWILTPDTGLLPEGFCHQSSPGVLSLLPDWLNGWLGWLAGLSGGTDYWCWLLMLTAGGVCNRQAITLILPMLTMLTDGNTPKRGCVDIICKQYIR